MRRSANEGEGEERAIKFRGSMKIVEGLEWHDDLLYPNTSFYRKLEAHIVDMVSLVERVLLS